MGAVRSEEQAEAATRERYARVGARLRSELGPVGDAWLRSSEAVAIHRDGRFVLVNDACLKLFGASEESDFLGRPVLAFARDDGRAKVEERTRLFASDVALEPSALHKVVRIDGVPIDIETTSVRFTIGDDTFIMTTARDVTERSHAQARTERNETALREAQRIAKVGSWDLDLVSGELSWSEEIYRIFEIDSRDFRASYEAFLELVHPDDRALVNHAYEYSVEAREPYSVEHRLLMRDGRIKYVHERGMTFYDAGGRPLRSLGTVQDVSAKVAAERAIAEREQLLQTIVDASPDWIFAKDHEFRFLMVNRAMAQAVGRTPSELVGRRDTEFWPVEECEPGTEVGGFHADDSAALRGEFVRVEREEASTAAGTVVLNTVKGPLRDASGNVFGAYAYARDITEADRMQQALRESEARLSLIFNTTQDLLVLLAVEPEHRLRVLAANQAASLVFSAQGPRPSLVGQDFHPLLFTLLDDADARVCERAHCESLRALSPRSYAFVSQILSGRHFDITVTPVAGADGRASFLLWTARDTTERARAEAALRESESRYRGLVEDQTEIICRFRADGTLVFVNEAGCRFVGLSLSELMTGSFVPFIVEEDLPLVEACLKLLTPSAPVASVEHRVRLKDGQIRWTRWTNRGFFDASGALLEIQSVGQDVTEQRVAAARIVAQLEEKEVLLREVHHRVKNNLQVVSSLLFLQRQRAQSPELNAMLRDSASRVAAMALVHEKLFSGSNLATVDMRGYARELGVSLMSTYAIEQIKLDVSGTPFLLPLDRATPYALIVNELITNSLKHAFPDGRPGSISIEMSDREDGWCLTIGDDGVGAPPNVLTSFSQSLGVRLVVRLVEQLDATIERLPGAGTVYRICGDRELPR